MRRASVVRCTALMAALLSISLISFPSFPSTIGFNPNPQTVNRELKGDRRAHYRAITVAFEGAQKGPRWLRYGF